MIHVNVNVTRNVPSFYHCLYDYNKRGFGKGLLLLRKNTPRVWLADCKRRQKGTKSETLYLEAVLKELFRAGKM